MDYKVQQILSNRKYDQTLLFSDPVCCQHHSCIRTYKCPEF